MPLDIHVSVSNVVTPDIKDKRGKPLTDAKSAKYQELCCAVGMSLLLVVFKSQGSVGQRIFEHFGKLILVRSEHQ